VTYSVKPFAFEANVQRQFGSLPATEASLAASFTAAPTPRLHLSIGAQINWGDQKFNQKFFGVTPADAAAATAAGNELQPYHPGSGITNAGIVSTGVYALTGHWGLVGRLGFSEIIGTPAKDSPLTQRTFGASVGLGAIYQF
jgi:outer membrane protein